MGLPDPTLGSVTVWGRKVIYSAAVVSSILSYLWLEIGEITLLTTFCPYWVIGAPEPSVAFLLEGSVVPWLTCFPVKVIDDRELFFHLIGF